MEEQEKNNSKIWIVSTMIFAMLFVISVIIALFLGNFNGIDKKTLAEEYIKKDDLTFYHLPTKIQAEYQKVVKITKNEINNTTNIVNTVTSSSSSNNSSNSVDLSLYISKDEYNKLKAKLDSLTIKTIDNNSSQHQTLIKEHDTNTLETSSQKVIQCLDMKIGDFRMSKSCHERLHKEIANFNNKNSFEVIGFVDINDFKVISHIKEYNGELLHELNLTKKDLDNLFEVANSGLGLKRANEAVWELKQKFGFDANIKSASYVITTYQKRGFAVKIK
ncbi:MAG: hypothetical protein HXX81_03340 [Campylobacterales bacterium]|nr:hypothetical protein [Campylobacterales bacterium]